jgi:release factor glutamine methyltransferase
MKVADALREFHEALRDAGIEDWRQSTEWLLTDALDCSRAHLYAYPDRVLTRAEVNGLRRRCKRRMAGEPIQYILGYTEFMGLRLKVTPDVLIPRPETESLVVCAVELSPGHGERVLDIGTGSGCIALALKYALPGAEVVACDVSAAALRVARENAASLGLDIELVACDLQSGLVAGLWADPFHIIVSNPPYVAEEERRTLQKEVVEHEPHLALFASGDPLAHYRAIGESAHGLLTDPGHLVVEVHTDRADDVARLLEREYAFDSTDIVTDLAGKPRIVSARLSGHRSDF